MSVDIEQLVPGATVRLPGRSDSVKLVAVEPGAYWTFIYEDANGVDRLTLAEDELAEMTLLDPDGSPRLT